MPLSKPLFSLAVTVRRLPSSASVAEAVNVTPRLSDLSDVAIAVDASAKVVPDSSVAASAAAVTGPRHSRLSIRTS